MHLSLSLRLHLSLSLSGILAMPSCQSNLAIADLAIADLTIADLATPKDRDRPGSPLIADPLCEEEEL